MSGEKYRSRKKIRAVTWPLNELSC